MLKLALAVAVAVLIGTLGAATALAASEGGSRATARAAGASHVGSCGASRRIVQALQRDSQLGPRRFGASARKRARLAARRMRRLQSHAPDRRARVLAARLSGAFRRVFSLASRRSAHGSRARRAVDRYISISAALLRHLSGACRTGGIQARASGAVYNEQQGHHGVNTFTNYHNASGMGPRIDPGAWVQVSCKVYDPYIQSVNPDGYWYRIASAPWSDNYYAPANTFMNGDPWNGPYTHNTDFAVPDCGAAPPPPPSAAALAQGPSAQAGFWYAVTVDHFAANSAVSVSCRDSVSPDGFRTFTLGTDANGHGSAQNGCYSGDGPDHWVVANGNVESNHVPWSSAPAASGGAGGTAGAPGTGSPGSGASSGGPLPGSGVGASGGPGPDTCTEYGGSRIADGDVALSLLGHYLGGLGDAVVIDWSYFSSNSSFVGEAKSLQIGQFVSGWAPPSGTDMYNALGHFTLSRDTVDCYLVYDHYDFDWQLNKKYLVFFPLWAIQIFGAREFDVHASGKL